MDEIFYRPSEFTLKNACDKHKKYSGIKTDSEGSYNYEKAIVMKEILKGFLEGDYDEGDVLELVSGGLANSYDLEETQKSIDKETADNYIRYIKGEKREKRNVHVAEPIQFKIGDKTFFWAPDAYCLENNRVEAIIYKDKKPDVNLSKTGIIPEDMTNLAKWFYAFCGLCWARAFAKKLVEIGSLPSGSLYTVCSSYYFMKKSTDGSTTKPRDIDFFSGDGGNIVTLIENHTYNEAEHPTEYDDVFIGYINNVDIGVSSCDEETCKWCEHNCVCNYTKPPIKIEKILVVNQDFKRRTPTPAQQAVIDAILE